MAIDPTTNELLALIASEVVDNNSELITPAKMRTVLNSIVNSLNDYADTDNLTQGVVNLFLAAAERSKLQGIEASADVTPPGATALEAVTLTETGQRVWSPAFIAAAMDAYVPALYPVVTQAEAEAGTLNAVRWWTPLRVNQAIAALGGGGGGGGKFYENTYNNVGNINTTRWIGFREAVDTTSLADYSRITAIAGTGHELIVRCSSACTVTFNIHKNTSGSAAFTSGSLTFTANEVKVIDISSLTTANGDWLAISIAIGGSSPGGVYVNLSITPS